MFYMHLTHRGRFIGELRESKRKIRGVGGVIQPKIKTGTLLWRWEDYQGQEHKFLITNFLFIPSVKCRLLSPQHWAQTRRYHQKLATETTDRAKVVLTWGNKTKQYLKTIPLGKKENVGTFCLSPGFNNFHLFFQQAMENPLDDDALVVAPSMIREEEEEDHPQQSDSNQVRSWTPYNPDSHFPKPTFIPPDEKSEGVLQDQWKEDDIEGELEVSNANNKDTPRSIYFEEPPGNFSLPMANQPSEYPSQSEATYAALLLRYHYQYGHISFQRLKKMAEQKVIPRCLKYIPTPAFLACNYAKSTKRSCRHKSQKNHKPPPPPTLPGEVVSVDQIVSPAPGMIA